MAVADAQDQRSIFRQLIKNDMRPYWTETHLALKPLPDRARHWKVGNHPESVGQLGCILLRLQNTEQPDSFAVDSGDIRLCLTREIDVHD